VDGFRRGHVPPGGDCVVGNYTLYREMFWVFSGK